LVFSSIHPLPRISRNSPIPLSFDNKPLENPCPTSIEKSFYPNFIEEIIYNRLAHAMTTVTVFFQDIFMKFNKKSLKHTFQDELKDPVTAQVRKDNIKIVAFN
jgi:hypothetical protein